MNPKNNIVNVQPGLADPGPHRMYPSPDDQALQCRLQDSP